MPPKRANDGWFDDNRPAKSRVVNISSSHNNRRHLAAFSTFTPTEDVDLVPEADSYDPPNDVEMDGYNGDMVDTPIVGSPSATSVQATGLPGIAVLAKARKRYENSVCAIFAIIPNWLRHATGFSPQNVVDLSTGVSR